jgi:hypothetical protein
MKTVLLVMGVVLLLVGIASAEKYVQVDYSGQNSDQISHAKPDIGKTFLLMKIIIANHGYEDIYTNPNYFSVMVDNVTYNYDASSHYLKDIGMPILDVNSHLRDGGMISGFLVFQIPVNASRYELIYDDYRGKNIRYNFLS